MNFVFDTSLSEAFQNDLSRSPIDNLNFYNLLGIRVAELAQNRDFCKLSIARRLNVNTRLQLSNPPKTAIGNAIHKVAAITPTTFPPSLELLLSFLPLNLDKK